MIADWIFDGSWIHGFLFKPSRASQELACGKLCCQRSTRPQAALAVELRQKALFPIATTDCSCFPQPANISVNPRYPRERP
jgi:hypothetical protein